MKPKKIGIINYGVGNHSSILRSFENLNYRCIVSCAQSELTECSILVLPGVGAFPAAMSALVESKLDIYIKNKAREGIPIIGLCLGMQLFADISYENGITTGLGLIPGEVVPLIGKKYHVGWNTIKVVNDDEFISSSDQQSVYFNHSFVFDSPKEFIICTTEFDKSITAGIRKNNIVGLQFHPEKSQIIGQDMLKNLVERLSLHA